MSPWKELIKIQNLSLLGFRETLEGGQSFSWYPTSEISWIGSFKSKVVELKVLDNNILWRTSLEYAATESDILNYLWLDQTYVEAVNNLPWRSDSVLAQCVQALPCLLYTSPSPRDLSTSRMPSSA